MARIRTIKPEFWQNEDLASLSEHARLLAIALLNHADDKGYFVATPQLVRAACFPFDEDSKNVLGSLQDLSRIGYIEIRDCDGKQIGHICKFLDHQRIDKAQKSKLIDLFAANPREKSDSTTIPGMFQECSENVPRLEQGKERKGKDLSLSQEADSDLDSITIPLVLDTEAFRTAWSSWLRYSTQELDKPVGTISGNAQLYQLMRLGPVEAAEAIQFTISRKARNLITNGDHNRPAKQTNNHHGRKQVEKVRGI